MPKILEGLKEKILETTRTELLASGFNVLTMRSIAQKLHIASGTLYNYFPSKEVLVASVMLEDWVDTIKKAQEEAQKASDALSALEAVYAAIQEYSRRFEPVWAEATSWTELHRRHSLLVTQIRTVIGGTCDRFLPERMEDLETFLSELILATAVRSDKSFRDIEPFIRKLIK